ncbi:MAG: YkvA family protein [Anaerolineae bacterium]
MIAALRRRAGELKRETYALYLAYRDPRTPWIARIVAGCVVAYAFSPLDLIPDFVPVLGYLDDLVLVPLGVALALRLIPPDVMAESRARARELSGRPVSWAAAAVIVAIWLGLAVLVILWMIKAFGRG